MFRRALLRGIGIVLAVLAVALLAVLWLLGTERGRAQVVEIGLPQLNAILPGTVHVQRIAELSLGAVELRGVRVDDPTGAHVLGVERVRVELRPWRALYGEILLSNVIVSGVDVDLRQLGEKRKGLIAAFVDPDQPDSPPSGQPPPHVRALHVSLTQASVRLLPIAPLGQLDLTAITLEGAYELRDGESIAEVTKLALAMERGGERLGQLERATLHLPPAPELGSISLELGVLQSRVVLTARGPAPWQDAADQAALDAKLELHDVLPGELAAKLEPAVALPEIHGPLAATLTAQGSARKLQAQLALQTAGGNAQLSANVRDFAHVTWAFDSAGLEPARVVPELDLPKPFVVAARLTGEVELAAADGSIAAAIDADLRLNGRRLPRVAGSARLHEQALHDVRLSLVDAYSKIALSGELGADRSVRAALKLALDARTVRELLGALGQEVPEARGAIAGQLQLEHAATTRVWGHLESAEFETGPVSLREFALSADLRGRVPALSGSAELRLQQGKLSDLEVRDVALSITGRPNHYTLTSAATLPERGSLELQLEASELSERGGTFSGSAHGQLAGEPWRLEVLPTKVHASGKLETKGVTLRVAEQELHARGRWGTESALELRARAIDLAHLRALATRLAPASVEALPALRGQVSFEAALSGSVSRPRAELKLSADGLGRADTSTMDLQLSSSLDTTAGSGRLEVELKASDNAGLRSKLLVQSQFARTHDWLNALIDGNHQLALELGRLDLDWLAAMSGISVPVHGQVEGQLNASLGTTLGLDWRGEATLRIDAEPGQLALQHTLSIGDRGVHTSLRAGGADDPVLTLEAALDVPLARQQLRSLVERGRSLALTQAWSLTLDVPTRDIRTFPLRSLVSADALPAVKLGLHAALEHAPHAEPSVQLVLNAAELKSLDENATCKPGLVSAALTAELRAGQLTAKFTGTQNKQQLISSELTAGFSLAKLLAGERVKPTDVQLRAHAQDVQLATLPFVCSRARGLVGLDLAVSEPFESAPKAQATLVVDGLTLANDTLNVRAELDANSTAATVKAELTQAGKASKLSASLPLRWSGGTLAIDQKRELTAQAKLDALPIAPFLPTSVGLSYASGSIGGDVSLRGSIANPHIAGKLELNDLAFTVTDLAQPIDHVKGRIRFDGRSITIEKLTAKDENGKLEITANATLKSLEEGSGKLRLVLEDFPVRQNGEVAATVEGDFSVSADVTRSATHIKLKIDKFDTYLESINTASGISLTPHPDLTVNGVPNSKPKQQASASESESEQASVSQRPLRIDIQSTRFWVKRDDFAMRLSADLSARFKGEETRFTGKILVERGYVDLLGKQFEISPNEGKLQFSGDSGTPDPIVLIKAHHDNRKTGDIIGVVIAGRSSAPELTFTVNDKKVDAGGAVNAIYGSKQSSAEAQQTATVQASAVLMGLTAGLVATAARRNMGALAPMLMIDPGDANTGGRVRAGFEFDSLVPDSLRGVITGVYVEGIVGNEKKGPEGEQTQSLKPGALLELYFPYNLFTSGQYGPGTTWSVDVGWQL